MVILLSGKRKERAKDFDASASFSRLQEAGARCDEKEGLALASFRVRASRRGALQPPSGVRAPSAQDGVSAVEERSGRARARAADRAPLRWHRARARCR